MHILHSIFICHVHIKHVYVYCADAHCPQRDVFFLPIFHVNPHLLTHSFPGLSISSSCGYIIKVLFSTLLFLEGVSYIPGWQQTQYLVKNDLELLILLSAGMRGLLHTCFIQCWGWTPLSASWVLEEALCWLSHTPDLSEKFQRVLYQWPFNSPVVPLPVLRVNLYVYLKLFIRCTCSQMNPGECLQAAGSKSEFTADLWEGPTNLHTWPRAWSPSPQPLISSRHQPFNLCTFDKLQKLSVAFF